MELMTIRPRKEDDRRNQLVDTLRAQPASGHRFMRSSPSPSLFWAFNPDTFLSSEAT